MQAKRNFPLLLTSQFLGAFGDNALLAVIIGQLTYLQQQGAITADELRTTSTLYTSLLFVPYVLLAPLAGYLNDRYSKTRWLAGGNALKLTGALCCAFTSSWGSLGIGVGYLIVGVGACVYSPAKYGILPEILPHERLVRGNGLIELLTLLAILLGAIGGAALSDAFHANVLVAYAIIAVLFTSALVCSLFISRTPAHPAVQLAASWREFTGHVGHLFRAPRLIRMLMGTALFWICGAALKINFQPWGLEVLGLRTNTEIALLGLWLSLGVMIGSITAGRLHAIGDLRAAPRYGAALATMLVVLFFVTRGWTVPSLTLGFVTIPVPTAFVLATVGMAAGLFLIPINAALQAESDPGKLGKTIAVQNLLENVAMCGAGVYTFAAAKAGLSPSGVFLGLAAIVGAAMIFLRFPPQPVASAVSIEPALAPEGGAVK